MRLEGCGVNPIGDYLKALGIFKVISEQADQDCACRWDGEQFILETGLTRVELIDFFQFEYSPIPITTPWNNGNGLNPDKVTEEWSDIMGSESPRLADYGDAIKTALQIIEMFSEMEAEKKKASIMRVSRNTMGDRAVEWIDSAFMELEGGEIGYPPITGTGGNDGRMDFSRNFAKSVLDVIGKDGVPKPDSLVWLRGSLFGEVIDSTPQKKVGMYRPFSAGGSNQSTTDFKSDSSTNPWDFILMMEGIVLLSSSAVKKLESGANATLASPWTVKPSGVGFYSSSKIENTVRAELWLPLWEKPCSLSDIRGLMSEGRAELGDQPAKNGIDFYKAISRLGVDRGITAFNRYTVADRNGQAYIIFKTGKVKVFRRQNMDLISELTSFMNGLRKIQSNENCPAGLLTDIRGLESAVLCYLTNDSASNLLEVLLCVGDCHRSLGRNLSIFKEDKGSYLVNPCVKLSNKWLIECYDGSPEFRLASSVASLTLSIRDSEGKLRYIPIHENLLPIKKREWEAESKLYVWDGLNPVSSMIDVLNLRIELMTKAGRGNESDSGTDNFPAVIREMCYVHHSLEDVSLFLSGSLDLRRFSRLLLAFSLIRHEKGMGKPWSYSGSEFMTPPANYSVLKLCHSNAGIRGLDIRLDRSLLKLLEAGRASDAVLRACRKLNNSGLAVPRFSTHLSLSSSRRLGASLLIPDNHWIADLTVRKLVSDRDRRL